MSLTSVKISEEVWMTCLTHALSTETEEIMGLLLGDIQPSKNGGETALIWGASPQPRCDRKKDRVETNPEQLTAASIQAELLQIIFAIVVAEIAISAVGYSVNFQRQKMSTETGRKTRVIGWYHSHPHITVLPSHVDVRTQAMYQLLDSGFIGLIFSCFSEDAHKVGRIQVIAFQSLDGKQIQISKADPISPVNKSAFIDLESSVSTSENASGSQRIEIFEQDTADSRAIVPSKVSGSDLGGFFASADASSRGKETIGGNFQTGSLDNALVDFDPMDMSDSMQEALLRSNLEISGAEYTRKEIPLYVLPAFSLLKLDSPLASFVDLQRVLFEEEQAAYNQAILQSMRDGNVHPLSFIHHTSAYQASLCKLMEYCLNPAINALQARLRENELRLSTLAEEEKLLEREIIKSNVSTTTSPRRSPRGVRESPVFGQSSTNSRSLGSPGSSRSRRGSQF